MKYLIIKAVILLILINQAIADDSKTFLDIQAFVPHLTENSLNQINDHDIVLGNKASKVLVIEYFSPTCPHCAYYHKRIFPQIKEHYIDNNKVAYVMREMVGNRYDIDSSILARCKGTQDSFLKFIEVILSQQNSWINGKYHDILTSIGQLGGIAAEEYANCLSNSQLKNTLVNNANLILNKQQVLATPNFVINGKVISAPHSFEALAKEIDKSLAEYQAG